MVIRTHRHTHTHTHTHTSTNLHKLVCTTRYKTITLSINVKTVQRCSCGAVHDANGVAIYGIPIGYLIN